MKWEFLPFYWTYSTEVRIMKSNDTADTGKHSEVLKFNAANLSL